MIVIRNIQLLRRSVKKKDAETIQSPRLLSTE